MKVRNQKVKALMLSAALGVTAVTSTVTPMLSTVTAYAAEYNTTNGEASLGSGTASITIKGNEGQTLVNKKFNVYKLFNAENSKDGESINYTFNPTYKQALQNVVATALTKAGKTTNADAVTEYMAIDYIQSLNHHKVNGAQASQTLEGSYSDFRYFVEAVRDEMARLKLSCDTVTVKNVKTDNSFVIKGIDYGYYIVDEVTTVKDDYSAASLCMVDTANPTADINIKSDYPQLIKKIQEDDMGSAANGAITDKDGWNDIADYEIGQTVPYRFTSTISNMNGYDTYFYGWHDKMDEALTLNKDSIAITIKGTVAGKEKSYTLKNTEFAINTNPGNGETFTVSIADIKAIIDANFNQMNADNENIYDQTVVLTYNATLNDKAAARTGRAGFENDVQLEFSNDADSNGKGTTGKTPWDTVVCFTYKLNVTKTNDQNKVLENAKFRLYSDKACTKEVFVKAGNGGYIVINKDTAGTTTPANAVEMKSDSKGLFTIFGLDQGTYYLKETAAPAGYRQLLDPIELILTPTFTADRDAYVKGESATAKTLAKLDSKATIKSFWDGVLHTEQDKVLTTNVADGSTNLTVVNKVGSKLPITGTSALALMIGTGTILMSYSVATKKRKEEK